MTTQQKTTAPIPSRDSPPGRRITLGIYLQVFFGWGALRERMLHDNYHKGITIMCKILLFVCVQEASCFAGRYIAPKYSPAYLLTTWIFHVVSVSVRPLIKWFINLTRQGGLSVAVDNTRWKSWMHFCLEEIVSWIESRKLLLTHPVLMRRGLHRSILHGWELGYCVWSVIQMQSLPFHTMACLCRRGSKCGTATKFQAKAGAPSDSKT